MKPFFPRWVPFGCGAAALVFLLILFSAGALVSGGGATKLIDFIFAQMQRDTESMFAPDVTADQRADFDKEWKTLQENMKAGKVPLERFQAVLAEIQAASADRRITSAETARMIGKIWEVNEEALRKKSAKKSI